MPTRALLLALTPCFFLAGLAGCGHEAGRAPLTGEGTSKATMTLAAGEVDFWTDIAIDYTGDASLQYHVVLEQGGATVASTTCNPLGHMSVKTTWMETNLGSSHSRSGMGKMDCSMKLTAGGPTDVTATLAFTRRPTTVAIKKADLVVKQ